MTFVYPYVPDLGYPARPVIVVDIKRFLNMDSLLASALLLELGKPSTILLKCEKVFAKRTAGILQCPFGRFSELIVLFLQRSEIFPVQFRIWDKLTGSLIVLALNIKHIVVNKTHASTGGTHLLLLFCGRVEFISYCSYAHISKILKINDLKHVYCYFVFNKHSLFPRLKRWVFTLNPISLAILSHIIESICN